MEAPGVSVTDHWETWAKSAQLAPADGSEPRRDYPYGMLCGDLQPYSRDGAAMLLVIEAMRAKGWRWSGDSCLTRPGYTSAFWPADECPAEPAHATADTLPHAGAKAALKALAGRGAR